MLGNQKNSKHQLKGKLYVKVNDVPYRPKEPVPNSNSKGSDVKTVCQKRTLEDLEGTADTLSKNKQKKRSRNPNKNFSLEQKRESNPLAAQTSDFLM